MTPAEIEKIRLDLHLSKKELATELGVTPATVSRWISGKMKIRKATERKLLTLTKKNCKSWRQ